MSQSVLMEPYARDGVTMRVRQLGVTLIESVVAIAILATGILGLAALQGRAMAMSQSVFYRSIAADLAADLAERIRVYRTPFLAMQSSAAVDSALAAALPPDFSKCTQNTSNLDAAPSCANQEAGHQAYLVATEMGQWNSALRSQLPNARYTLVALPAGAGASPVAGFYRYTLTITWQDNRTVAAPDFTYTTVIE